MVEEKRTLITSTAVRELVKIYGGRGQELTGSVTNEFLRRTVYFQDVVGLLAILEQTYDFLSFPQSTFSYRSFHSFPRQKGRIRSAMKAGVKFMEKRPPELEHQNEKASFLVHVQFRQHATWQGSITWVEKGVTQYFRSTLEMLRLMSEALEDPSEEHVTFENGEPFLE